MTPPRCVAALEERVAALPELELLARTTADPPVPPTRNEEPRLALARYVPARSHRALAVAGVVCGLLLAWLATSMWGNEPVTDDLMYVPIFAAGWFFGVPGGVIAAVAAALLLGPFALAAVEPDDVIEIGLVFVGMGALAGYVSSLLVRRLDGLGEMALRLGATYANTLSVIASSLELRDRDTGGHSARVAANAKTLGRLAGLGADEQTMLLWAGMLHDLGKIGVPESILHKSGPLTPEERHVMQGHVLIGVRILEQSSPDFADVAALVACHHERWDGLGYPVGRAGERIPLAGRLLAIADTFDALTSTRPYREALTQAQAVAYLHDKSGSQFDPGAVRLFDEALASGDVLVGDVPVTQSFG